MRAAPAAFGRSGRSRSQAVPGSTDKIGDEPGGQKRPARRGAARRPPDASKSSPILPGIGFAFLLSSDLRAATQPPIEFRDRLLCLLEFHERPAEILGMQEQHGLAVRAGPRLAVAEHARALRLERVARGADVVDLGADVMDAAVGIALEEFRDRRA